MALHYSTSFTHLINLLSDIIDGEVFIVTDSQCFKHCVSQCIKEDLVPSSHVFTFPAGEESKSIETYTLGIDFLAKHKASRNTDVLNIGGGVTTDLGGFIATTYKRGIPFINIPTSLLGMVDAAHGGKVGINHRALKNYIGAFSTPIHTIICPSFLQTLPNEHLVSGYAEMLKHGIISNATYWNALKIHSPAAIDSASWLPHIKRSIDIKTNIVNADPMEMGLRKILNFGHTVGHAIESHLLDTGRKVLHGHAIAFGMVIESQIASHVNGLSKESSQDIMDHINQLYDRMKLKPDDVDPILNLMTFDKKNENKAILMSLPSAIGECDYNINVDADLIKSCLIEMIID